MQLEMHFVLKCVQIEFSDCCWAYLREPWAHSDIALLNCFKRRKQFCFLAGIANCTGKSVLLQATVHMQTSDNC